MTGEKRFCVNVNTEWLTEPETDKERGSWIEMSQNKEEKGTKQSADALTPNLFGLNQLRCVGSFDSVCLDWCKGCQWNSGADQQQPDKDSLKRGLCFQANSGVVHLWWESKADKLHESRFLAQIQKLNY